MDLMSAHWREDEEVVPEGSTPLPKLLDCGVPEFLTALQKGLGVEFQIPRSETLKVDFVYSLGNVPANNIYGLQDGDCIRVLEIIELPGVYTSFVVAVFNSDGSERRIKDKGYVLRIPDALIDKMSLVQVMDLSNMKREGL